MGIYCPVIVMFKHAVIAISSFSLINAAAVPKSDGPSCSAPNGSKVDWVGCAVDNAWYGVSKQANYDHFSAEFRLCAGLGGHVAWMDEEDEDTCAAQAMIQTKTIDEYRVFVEFEIYDIVTWFQIGRVIIFLCGTFWRLS